MHPFLRIWAVIAAFAALMLIVRGAWLPAAALFLFSPAPVWLLSRAPHDRGRLSYSWLALVAGGSLMFVGAIVAIAYYGGLPQVHEWRGALQSAWH